MPVKIAICDDAAEDIAQLSGALFAYDPLFEITSFTSGKALIDELLENNIFADLLFLDICMPGIDGIETAQKICAMHKNIKIIFLSSSRDYYPQAFEVFAFNYIIKPFSMECLYAVLNHALDELQKERGYKICVQHKGTTHSVNCRDILYLESRDKLLLFHLVDECVLQCYGRLEEILKELPEQFFLRCHQSFIVNLTHVAEMGENYLRVGPAMIGISRKYRKEANDQYYAYLFSHMGGGRPQ